MTVINFKSEANKRNITIKDPEPLTEVTDLNEDGEALTVYQGNFIHKEDRVRITVDTVEDKVDLDVYDIKTNEKYLEFTFDSYTLFLIVEAARRMFKELEGEIL